jgi:cellulose synthase/poly-beta-1,6-N-acetylglucosamine synthase-like glycosyltransferase
MTWRFRRWEARHFERSSRLPSVTVQLPLYNERTVAARLIRAVGVLDYPREKLEIQVLDDSSDETCAIVDAEVRALVSAGLDAHVLRRPSRAGYKAGALAFGLERARGECIAIFDADFVPAPDFLRALVPAFADERVGMVQARWDHVNRMESLLTRAQATLLDGHFVIEHTVRFTNGLFFNFNGTAGIWRRAAIDSAGGWQHDTLTEDLDLSYRAQLADWRFVYVPDVAAPAEVPGELSAFLSQQHRWAKGSVQVARKLARRVASSSLPWRVKLEAFAHLSSNCGYPLVVVLAFVLPLVALETSAIGALWHLTAFLVCTLSVVLFYARGQRALSRSWRQWALDVPAALALGVGMSLAQTRAVLEGALRRTGEFVRTPKCGDAPVTTRYATALRGWPLGELALAAYFAWAVARAIQAGLWGSLPFLGLFLAGFAWVGALTVAERFGRRERTPKIERPQMDVLADVDSLASA